jgi:hypothetical protein
MSTGNRSTASQNLLKIGLASDECSSAPSGSVQKALACRQKRPRDPNVQLAWEDDKERLTKQIPEVPPDLDPDDGEYSGESVQDAAQETFHTSREGIQEDLTNIFGRGARLIK